MDTETNGKKEGFSKDNWLQVSSVFKGNRPIDSLFDRFCSLYANRWDAQFKFPEQIDLWKECWSQELNEREITFNEAKKGLRRCLETHAWPPSFSEFLQACRPSLDPEQAFHEALKQMRLRDQGKDEWSSAVIFHAAVSMGRDLMSYSYQQVKARWANALEEARKGIENGSLKNEVHRRPILIEATKRSERPGGMSEVAIWELEKMKEILSAKPKWQRDLEGRTGRKYKADPNLRHAGSYGSQVSHQQQTTDEQVTIEG